MDYSKLIKNLTAEMKKGVQYARLPLLFKIFAIVALSPIIATFVISIFFYWVTLFFYKMISSPADSLHLWLKGQKDEVKHATQAVMYVVCLPFIFFLKVLLSFTSVYFFIQWFFIMIQGYILSLGGIKWQPFITEASFDEDTTEYTLKPGDLIAKVTISVLFGTFAATLLCALVVYCFDSFEFYKLFDDFGLYKKITNGITYVKDVFNTLHTLGVFVAIPVLFKRTPKN